QNSLIIESEAAIRARIKRYWQEGGIDVDFEPGSVSDRLLSIFCELEQASQDSYLAIEKKLSINAEGEDLDFFAGRFGVDRIRIYDTGIERVVSGQTISSSWSAIYFSNNITEMQIITDSGLRKPSDDEFANWSLNDNLDKIVITRLDGSTFDGSVAQIKAQANSQKYLFGEVGILMMPAHKAVRQGNIVISSTNQRIEQWQYELKADSLNIQYTYPYEGISYSNNKLKDSRFNIIGFTETDQQLRNRLILGKGLTAEVIASLIRKVEGVIQCEVDFYSLGADFINFVLYMNIRETNENVIIIKNILDTLLPREINGKTITVVKESGFNLNGSDYFYFPVEQLPTLKIVGDLSTEEKSVLHNRIIATAVTDRILYAMIGNVYKGGIIKELIKKIINDKGVYIEEKVEDMAKGALSPTIGWRLECL
ncbi:MAG: hypothetical protein LBH98_00425, partial [Chitinispirillales bacterium]|nr:hypothetical protein [Chitinispirillales bacterium]